MNVYDFDKTIYDGDCTVDFVFYCFKRYPTLLKHIPLQLGNGILFITKLRSKQIFKEKLYSFLQSIPNIDSTIQSFTDSHLKNVKAWYFQQQRSDDLIISASPEFLIGVFCKKLSITQWMASPVDPFTGKYNGKNCYGQEKVRRFDEFYQRYDVESFYSDSYSDDPLAQISKQAYLVKGNKLLPWKK
ncbi:MAG: haloacid dehalogenase-like hydrolase [Anaerorhabdus sp.]